MMKAAFNLAAKDDPRIANAAAWWNGLTKLPEAEPPANKILTDDAVRRIVAAARQIDAEFGLLVEVLAVTEARPSQALRIQVADVRDQQLMMPSSKKGGEAAPRAGQGAEADGRRPRRLSVRHQLRRRELQVVVRSRTWRLSHALLAASQQHRPPVAGQRCRSGSSPLTTTPAWR